LPLTPESPDAKMSDTPRQPVVRALAENVIPWKGLTELREFLANARRVVFGH
jgi:hypothetical protein